MVAGDANEPDVGIKVILKLQGLIKTYFQTKAVFLLCLVQTYVTSCDRWIITVLYFCLKQWMGVLNNSKIMLAEYIMNSMAIRVIEFSYGGYKIRKIFA